MFKVKILDAAKEFIQKLELKIRAKTFKTIELLKEFGPYSREPHSKKIKGSKKLFELRVKQ